MVKEFAFNSGTGDSTLMSLRPLDDSRRNSETIIGDFGSHTLSSTIKTKSLFRNYDHKHVDQVDGSTFQDRLVRPGEPIRNKIKHDTELVNSNQHKYDNFLHSWKKSSRLQFNNDLSPMDDETRKRQAISKQDEKLKGILEEDVNEDDVNNPMKFRSIMFKNDF